MDGGNWLISWFGHRLIGRLVDLEPHNFADGEDKNYPDQRACQRVEKEIFQCISLAVWQHQLDNGANDISALLNDTCDEGNHFSTRAPNFEKWTALNKVIIVYS
ncbi:hypothetical protein HFO90_03215 [Rhizobium leguminosarum]|nr:hypothetical protein [Rhizobium leguminosarum]NDK51065.1 hypothetical protein [Rhizobium laguerreae]